MKKPNIFSYATKELSQDAMIAWIFAWASDDYKDEDENKLGRAFCELIMKRAGVKPPDSYYKVEILRQYKNVDILCKINDSLFILVEDKVNSRPHSDQLSVYKRKIEGLTENIVICVYVKTGVENNDQEAIKNGYLVVNRNDLIKMIYESCTTNLIAVSFLEHLKYIDKKYNGHLTNAISDWDESCWSGFFEQLSKDIEGSKWARYHTGNNQVFHWGWSSISIDGQYVDPYLEIKNNRLCFRLSFDGYSYDRLQKQEFVKEWLKHIVSSKYISATDDFGSNSRITDKFQTVLYYKNDFRKVTEKNILDYGATLNNLIKFQQIHNELIKAWPNKR